MFMFQDMSSDLCVHLVMGQNHHTKMEDHLAFFYWDNKSSLSSTNIDPACRGFEGYKS